MAKRKSPKRKRDDDQIKKSSKSPKRKQEHKSPKGSRESKMLDKIKQFKIKRHVGFSNSPQRRASSYDPNENEMFEQLERQYALMEGIQIDENENNIFITDLTDANREIDYHSQSTMLYNDMTNEAIRTLNQTFEDRKRS